ncbi:class I SAM-dependent methyltransferase [Mycolicibacterium holsaticum]|uniref:class I SAM-dependent methyltransferase n=1 Tax=Mycolicibacterium holsaticum TaxID=152142 RepID=UPI001C7E0CBF|nr:class I SAM-dependent methyltransferase [Mycolicibacterium holsaticum]MDA4110257.1 SAM-dependent methyltransferase [Mycolicibacterium holsaticum DSM 44478 = JCM 12374]QZA11849.1 methyltransferase domain-containing protein [Mycolicibacterium holsaticum DSM 44478 = JCM 12374]UNC10663.1 methyltransferase domain-containing protein [Mycolicibacterium holsaticum DSM 44478 = JCM 12374]
MSERDRVRWEERYQSRAAPPVADVRIPAVFAPFENMFPTGGQALDLACGLGQTSVWLARRGMEVWGVDISTTAISRARDLAARRAVGDRCRFDVVDLDSGLPAGRPADVVVCQRFRDRRLDQTIIGRLSPGGLLAISARSVVGAGPGPFRVAPGELTTAFDQLQIIAAGEGDGEAWLLAKKR